MEVGRLLDGLVVVESRRVMTRQELIEKLRTTPMGVVRIKRNLNLQTGDIVAWCKNAVQPADRIVG